MEYIFSAELEQARKSVLKRDRETNEEIMEMKKNIKFYATLEDETKCGICNKMIYECASVVPCLHRVLAATPEGFPNVSPVWLEVCGVSQRYLFQQYNRRL